jgi:Flp pilus assembly protein TadG
MVVRLETSRRCAGDDGASLVEAAFITPVLFYFLLGIMEYGLAFRSYLTLGNGLRAGARTASIYGNDAEADYRTIQAVKNETFAIKSTDIVKLIIFKANAAGSPAFTRTVPAACLAASVSSYVAASSCNIYGPTRDWNPSSVAPGGPELHYGCTGASTDWAAGWCPTTRFAAATNGGTPVAGPPDYVGVYLEINHKYVSGLFGTTRKISDVNVAQIEPKSQI